MNDIDTISDAEETDKMPRKSRQPKAERRVFVYRLLDGKPKEQGSFPEAMIGDPLERRLPTFLKEMFGTGEFKVETRKTNGHFERSFEFSIADTEPERERVIDVEPENDADNDGFDEPDYDMSGEIEARAELIALRREMAEMRRLERERQEAAKDSQGETLAMIREMQKQSDKSFQQGLQMAQMIMQSAQPKENPSELMLAMLKGTLEVQRGVRELSEEIAPPESGGAGSLLSDGAKLIDSLGRNAGTFLPLLMGGLPKTKVEPIRTPAPNVMVTNGDQSGDLADLAKKIQQKEGTKK